MKEKHYLVKVEKRRTFQKHGKPFVKTWGVGKENTRHLGGIQFIDRTRMKTAWEQIRDRAPEKTDKVQNLSHERPSAF